MVEGQQWLNQAKSEFGASEKRLIRISFDLVRSWCVNSSARIEG